MPFPVLFVPALVAATKTAAASAGYYISGGFVGGAGLSSVFWYRYLGKDATILPEHTRSLDVQHQLTEERINIADIALELLCHNVANLTEKVSSAASDTSLSVEHLQEFSKEIARTSERLHTVIGYLQRSNASIDKSVLALKVIEEKFHRMSAKSQAKLGDLKELLSQKEQELSLAADNIRSLHVTVDEQSKAIAQLSLVVKTLVDDNATLEQTIDANERVIDRLQTSSTRFEERCRFFQHIITQQAPPGGVLPPISTLVV